MRIITFTFFLDGGVPEAAHRRTQTLNRLVSNPEGFRQSMFQDFSLCIECLLSRWWNRDVSQLRKDQAEFLQYIPSAQPASKQDLKQTRSVCLRSFRPAMSSSFRIPRDSGSADFRSRIKYLGWVGLEPTTNALKGRSFQLSGSVNAD